ncbi:MAG: hypothetical protein RIB52_07265 [Erythrobacter sp.]|uniref:tetratricopeptide repeat protein n=1 Tax=Erythrobacter sp. TaxID=1042 RepID=UPI0032EDDFF5
MRLTYPLICYSLSLLLLALTVGIFQLGGSDDVVGSASPGDAQIEVSNKEAEGVIDQLRYERDIANIRADVLSQQSSWFEILIAAFGILISVIVIYFAFRFGNAAVAEAKLAALQATETERQTLLDMVEEAKTKLKEIEDHRSAAEALANTPLGEEPKDDENRQSIREIAKAAIAKPKAERTVDDFRALIVQAVMDKDWPCVLRRARAMEYLFDEADPKDAVFALFYRGVAHSMLEQFHAGLDAYTELVERFGETEDEGTRSAFAAALVNKGITLGQLEKPEDEIAVYDDLVRRFGESEEPALREQVAMALVNKGVALARMKKLDDARLVFEETAIRFEKSDETGVRKQVTDALFNLACVHALKGRVADTIDALKRLAAQQGFLDCDRIKNDPDFDLVRDRATFKRYLVSQGCEPDQAS